MRIEEELMKALEIASLPTRRHCLKMMLLILIMDHYITSDQGQVHWPHEEPPQSRF